MYVLGTAGHVDHGKSTLVKALTGIDPDRLKEEKDRQMTIDLGFAWYTLPSGNEVGIVDVPGHRDFIDNMLAGVGGIDAVLLVIAADEGIMPQTREHLAILKLLKIKYGLIVLTKIDLVDDPEWLDLVETDVRNLVQGSFLESADILRVSAYSKEGLDKLSQAIEKVLLQCPPKRNIGKPRLPIDRVFSLKGFGTIVTGTLLDGDFSNGQVVEVLPDKRSSRIRSIQSHKRKVDLALPGNRTAINLVGLEKEDIKRGEVVVLPGDYSASRRIDAKVEMLADTSGKINHNDMLKCFIGTAQSIVRVRVIGKKEIQPGERGWVQMEFDDAVVCEKGDGFILRRPSPAETIAGGEVLNPRAAKRYKRFSEESTKKMQVMESGSDQDVLLANLDKQGVINYQDFLKVSGFEAERTREIVLEMVPKEALLIEAAGMKDSLLISRTNWSILKENVRLEIDEYYRQHPLRESMTSRELNDRLKLPQKTFNLVIDVLVKEAFLQKKNGKIGLYGYSIQFSDEEQKTVETILAEYAAQPLQPPALHEAYEKYGEEILNALLDKEMLLRMDEDVALLPEAYEKLKKDTVAYLKKESKITLGQFRDLFQTSRKYALAYLEFLDKEGITQREEDYRTLSAG